jgi:hypothetical protein
MHEYLLAFFYIILGLIGAAGHYFKKRYIDETTDCSFKEYVLGEPKSTIKALFTIFSAEIALSLTGTWPIGLNQLIGALTAGYTADSGMNKAPDYDNN